MSLTDIFSGLSDVVSDVFGGGVVYELTYDGEALASARGVFKREHREASLGDYGAKVWVHFPALDLSTEELFAGGVVRPEEELHGAQVEVSGEVYYVSEVRPGSVFTRCMLSLP